MSKRLAALFLMGLVLSRCAGFVEPADDAQEQTIPPVSTNVSSGGGMSSQGGTLSTGGTPVPPAGGGVSSAGGTVSLAGQPSSGGVSASGGTASAGGSVVFADSGTYGVPVDNAPSWQERTELVITNAARVAPQTYKLTYGADFKPSMQLANVMNANVYPAVAPVRWNASLGQSARAHSQDMGMNNCFQHQSCNGTDPFVRIGSYYNLSKTMGENIAAGNSDPRVVINQWLCDASAGACCADKASCDGHRGNIMSKTFQAMGVGFAFFQSATYRYYSTQDFGGTANGPLPPLIDGSHFFYPQNQTTFAATYSAAAAPIGLVVVVSGMKLPLELAMGTSTRGHWSAVTAKASMCRSYHFEAIDSNHVNVWRYPAHGEFRTFGEGSCQETYLP